MAYPTLNQNAVLSTLHNMILSIHTLNGNISGDFGSLRQLFVQGVGRFGDTVLERYYDTPVIKKFSQTNANDTNVLATNYPKVDETPIVIDDFKRVFLTIAPQGFESMAFQEETFFSEFITAVLEGLTDAERVEKDMTANTFIGCVTPNNTIEVTLGNDEDVNTMAIANAIMGVESDMKYPSRAYNSKGFLKSFGKDDLVLIWNDKFVHKMTTMGKPIIFNTVPGLGDMKYTLRSDLFGDVAAGKVTGDGTYRAYKSFTYTPVGGVETYVVPGDVIPTGVQVPEAGFAYVAKEDDENKKEVICRIVSKDFIKILDGFNLRTEWSNAAARNATNHYYYIGQGMGTIPAGACVDIVANFQ